MIRRLLAIAAVLLSLTASVAPAQELTTDAERSWRELRNSEDVKTKLMAERWYSVVRQQDWSDASGKFKTSAKYVEHDPQLAWVKLRVIRGTGDQRVVKDVQIPLEKLNKACQARVRQIARLSEKVAEAIEEEKKSDDEKDAAGGPGEMASESRGGFAASDGGRAGLEAEQDSTEREPRRGRRDRRAASLEPARVTNDGPPLPALLPPLPALALPASTSESAPPPANTDAPVEREAAPKRS